VVGRAHVRKLEIDELTVHKLHVVPQDLPPSGSRP
jgi:hypothetical protein